MGINQRTEVVKLVSDTGFWFYPFLFFAWQSVCHQDCTKTRIAAYFNQEPFQEDNIISLKLVCKKKK